MNIENYGYRPVEYTEAAKGIPARVTAVYRNRYEVVCGFGTGFAHLKTGEYRGGDGTIPATGDFVLLDWQSGGESRILKTLPRKTYFSRLDPSSGCGEQAVAANFDYVFIMQSLDRNFNPRRLERYLTLAWQSGATPVVILTKSDSAGDVPAHVLAAQKSAVGVDVLAISVKTGEGVELLSKYLKPGKTIVFLGSSGVGKSTLVNYLAGEEVMATNSVRKQDGRGRHTTSRRQLLLLDSGVLVIDTPGMRELGMWDASKGLTQSFSDVEQYLGHCRFNDCRHLTEPGCAIKEAIRKGELPFERWESYLKLHTEAKFIDDKTSYLREKQKRFKEIAKLQKEMLSQDYRHTPCTVSFLCEACKMPVTPENAGSRHRNHCPNCLSSIHADNRPGNRASHCKGRMEPITVWVRKNGEWAVIHRCRSCGALSSNRIAADDNIAMLLSIAMRPMQTPFPMAKKSEEAAMAVSSGAPFFCKACGCCASSKKDGKDRDHCPHCLSSVHSGYPSRNGKTACEGTMEPIAVWIQGPGNWVIIQRCRDCGALAARPAASDDNHAYLTSIAIKPLSAPPSPRWQADGIGNSTAAR